MPRKDREETGSQRSEDTRSEGRAGACGVGQSEESIREGGQRERGTSSEGLGGTREGTGGRGWGTVLVGAELERRFDDREAEGRAVVAGGADEGVVGG